MTWCFRILLFVAVLFGGRALGSVTVTISEIPDAVYVTTIITVYDGTVTPTDSIETATLSSEIQFLTHAPPRPPSPVPPSVFIPLPRPSKDSSSSSLRPSTFITQTTTDSPAASTITATFTTSGAATIKQSETPSPPSSTESTISTGKLVGIVIGVLAFGFILAFFAARHISGGNGHDSSVCCGPLGRLLEDREESRDPSREKRAERLQRLGDRIQGEAIPAELDATTELGGQPLASGIVSSYSRHPAMPVAGELDGSSTVSHNHPSFTIQILPVELPTSADPGNSPLPRYEDLDTGGGGHREFSWAAPESAYRPDKLGSGNRI